jgi:methionyl-tRNA formyltransferase
MNITLLCNRDLASCVALNHLLPALAAYRVTVFLSSQVGKASPHAAVEVRKPEALDTLKFFEQTLVNDIIFPLCDGDEANSGAMLTFKGLERFLAAPIRELNTINTTGLPEFAATKPDLVLSIRYGVILREEAISVPTHGVINLHSGRLPNYRGVMATFRAMLNGDKELNMTLHTIDDSGIDTGRIVATTSFQVDQTKSYLWHVLGLYKDGCELLADTVNAIGRGEPIESLSQKTDANAGSYFTFPTQKELDEFTARGFRLVDGDEIKQVMGQFYGQS